MRAKGTYNGVLSKVTRAGILLGMIVAVGPAAFGDIVGFGDGTGFTLQGSVGNPPVPTTVVPFITDGTATMTTNAGYQASTVFYNTKQKVNIFWAQFVYRDVTAGADDGDGLAFIVQNDPRGPSALGEGGHNRGYGGEWTASGNEIVNSGALLFNIYNGSGIGVGANGSVNGGGGHDPTTPVDLTSGHPIRTTVMYDAATTTATVELLDLTTGDLFTVSDSTVDIPALVNDPNDEAYIGFGGGTGGAMAEQTISDFLFLPLPKLPQTYIWGEAGDGNWGDLNYQGSGHTGWKLNDLWSSTYPNGDIAVIKSDEVTVERAHKAFSVAAESGALRIANNRTLEVRTTIEMDDGTVLTLTPGSKLIANSGGMLADVLLEGAGAFTIETGGLMSAAAMEYDPVTPGNQGTFVKQGGGTLSVDADNSWLEDVTLHVNAGTLALKGAEPLAGVTQAVLGGGTLSLQGLGFVPKDDALAEWWFAGSYGDQDVGHAYDVDNPPSLLTQDPHVAQALDTSLDLSGLDMSTRGNYIFNNSQNDPTNPDQVGLMVHGTMHVETGTAVEPGDWLFFALESDDRSTAWFDLDGDDDLELAMFPNPSEEISTDVAGGGWSLNSVTRIASIGAADNKDYRVAFGFQEGGGEEHVRVKWWAGDTLPVAEPFGPEMMTFINDHMQFVDPSDPNQQGIWKGLAPVPLALDDLTVTVTGAGSRLDVVPATADPVVVKEVIMKDGGDLATSMSGVLVTGITFSKTVIDAGARQVGFSPDVETILTGDQGLVNNVASPNTLTIQVGGSSGLVLNRDSTGMGNVTFQLRSGRLVARVPTGVSTDDGSHPLGDPDPDAGPPDDATVEFAGGTLRIEIPTEQVTTGTLTESWWNSPSAGVTAGEGDAAVWDARIDPIHTAPGLLTQLATRNSTRALDRVLHYETGDANSRSAGATGVDDFYGMWHGTITVGGASPLRPGVISFGTASDDGSTLWIDTDPTAGGENWVLVVSNKGFHGEQIQVGDIYLAEGTYDVATAFWERGGDDQMQVRFGQGAGLSWDDMTGNDLNPTLLTQCQIWGGDETLTLMLPPGAIDWTAGNDLIVTAGGTLDAPTTVQARFGLLKLQSGVLTTTGAMGGMSFETSSIEADDATVGIDARVVTTLTDLDGKGHTNVTFHKQGGADLLIAGQGAGLEGTAFTADRGRLIALAASNPVDGATLQVGGPGDIVLSLAKADPPRLDPDAADYTSNAVHVVADGMLTAGSGGYGEDGVPVTVNLGSPPDAANKGVTLDPGATVQLRSTDRYLLNVLGNVAGDGGISFAEGNVTLAGQSNSVGTMTITGGTISTGSGEVTIRQELKVGDVSYRISPEGTLLVSGTDLVSETNLTLQGGTLTVAPPRGEPIYPDGAIAYWPLDDAAAGVTPNRGSAGAPLNGTLTGDATLTADGGGKIGEAVQLDGDADYVTAGYDAALGLNEFTVSAWVNLASEPGVYGILGTRFGPDYTFDYKVTTNMIHGDIGNGAAWINLIVDIDPGDTGTTGQGGDLALDTWYLVTYVINNAAQRCELYIDGDLKKIVNYGGTPLLMQSGQTLRIGDSWDVEYMHGMIDEVLIYGKALDAAEVAVLYDPDFVYAAVEQDSSNILVTADAEIDSPSPDVTLGNLAVTNPDPPADPTTLTLSGTFYNFNDVIAEDGVTIVGDLSVGGLLSPAAGVGKLNLDGKVVLAQATYRCEIDGSGADLVEYQHPDLDLILGDVGDLSTLDVQVLEQLGDPAEYPATILSIVGAGELDGDFQDKPAGGDYLAYGVFLDGYDVQPGSYNLNLFQSLEGDTDGDGDVDPTDLSTLVQNWAPAGTDKGWRKGNFNDWADGDVDPSDLSALVQSWAPAGYPLAEGAPPPGVSAAVPEPSTIVLLGAGVVWLIVSMWRKAKAPEARA